MSALGCGVMAEYLLDGRACLCTGTLRVPHGNRAWGFYNRVGLRWLDGQPGPGTMPAGQFNARAKATGRRFMVQAGQHVPVDSSGAVVQ